MLYVAEVLLLRYMLDDQQQTNEAQDRTTELGREDAVISLIENTDAALRPGIPAAGRRFFAAAQKQKTDVPEHFF